MYILYGIRTFYCCSASSVGSCMSTAKMSCRDTLSKSCTTEPCCPNLPGPQGRNLMNVCGSRRKQKVEALPPLVKLDSPSSSLNALPALSPKPANRSDPLHLQNPSHHLKGLLHMFGTSQQPTLKPLIYALVKAYDALMCIP